MRPSRVLTAACALVLLGARPSLCADARSPVAVPPVLALVDAQNIALAASPQLELARASVDQALASLGSAASAALPQLSANASVGQIKPGGGLGSAGGFSSGGTSGGSSGGGAFGATAFSQTTASLNLRQLSFDGGRVRSQIVAAGLSADAARLQLRRQVQTVLFNVAQQYYAALQARHQSDIARDSRRQALVGLQLVQAQYRAGVAAQADVQTAQLPVAQADLAVAQAQNGERTALAALLNTMGVPPQTPAELKDESAVSGSVPTLGSALDVALQSRPDALAARAALDSAKASARAARVAHSPSLSATASDGVTNVSVSGPGYNNNYSYGVGLTFPLSDGGQIRAQVAAADAQVRTANANLRTADLAVILSVEQGVLGLQTAQAGLTAADAELAQARTVLNVTNAQYKAGVTTLPLLLNAQTSYSKAESDHINAIYAYKIAQQQLTFAEGVIGS